MRRRYLGLAHIFGCVKNLTLEVADVNHIIVDQSNSPNPCCCEVHGHGRAQTACSNNEYAGCLEALLTFHTNIWETDVTSMPYDINHDTAKPTAFIKETASMNVVFKPFFDIDGG